MEALKQLRLARRAAAANERVDDRLERAIADAEAARDRLAYLRTRVEGHPVR